MKKCQVNVRENRITLSSLLTPHFGYELETGIGCTFTLDFETVLSVFYSLGMKDEIPEKLSPSDKLQLQRGIKKYSDKLAFYCSDCSISIPRKQSFFNGMMDKCVFEVNPKNAAFPHNGYFHPKVWILLYKPTANNEHARPYIKVIVSSRNISKSSNLDYAVALEAAVKDKATKESTERTKPLIDWLDYLTQFTPEGKQENIKTLKDFISRSEDWTTDYNKVYSASRTLRPLGISEKYDRSTIDLLNKKKEKEWLIVVSPFLGEDFIKELTDNGTTPDASSLLTRKSSLTADIWNSFTNVYGLRSILSNNELISESIPSDSDDDEIIQYRDIHAKMYFYRSDKRNMLLTGSANATNQAFNQNVEFMLQLELPSNARTVSYESICEELFQLNENGNLEPTSPFEEIELSEDDGDVNSKTDENEYKIGERRRLCEKILGATAQREGDAFTIIVKTSEPLGSSYKIAPLNAKDSAVELTTVETRIPGLSLEQLSNFYIIETPNDRFIKIIETKDIPVHERDNAVVNTIIENKNDFYMMVELFLADLPANVIAQWEINHSDREYNSRQNKASYIPNGIYERALEVAVSNIESFEELKSFIESVSEDKVDSQLVKMLETFSKALSNNKQQ